MTAHFKQTEIHTLVNANMNVLLEGERGSGKSTIIKNVAEILKLEFYTISMTKQTTLNSLLGFISINGTYIPSLLRKAVEEGGLMLLDELDAADPNVILCLNTLENGYLACPDKSVKVHKNFRLCATANPSHEHQLYTGRSKLDAASLDRFEKVTIERDDNLEIKLTDQETAYEMSIMRRVLSDNNLSKTLSMRDTIRFHKRKALGLAENYEVILLDDSSLLSTYKKILDEQRPKEQLTQVQCQNIDDIWDIIKNEGLKYTDKELKTLAKNWVASKGEVILPLDISIQSNGFDPANPFGEVISIYVNHQVVLKINEKDL